jgi:type IV pilus assembly protein PilE
MTNTMKAGTVRANRGFTLIELMIVVVIISVLATIAFQSYQSSVQRTNIAEVKADMLAAMADADAWRARNFTYSGWTLPTSLSGSDHYTVTRSADANAHSLTLSAIPTGGMTGTGALALSSQGQTCHTKSSDSACTPGASPWE